MGTSRWINNYVQEFPIPSLNVEDQNLFADVIDKTIAIIRDDDYLTNLTKQAQVHEYERQIDQMVYKLYGLTGEEIKIVEDASGSTAKQHALKSTRTNASTQS